MVDIDRGAQLAQWLQRNAARPCLRIDVSDANLSSKTSSSFLSSASPTLFTLRTVSPLGEEWRVDRSMSDFALLRQSLLSRYAGAVLPQLPPELTHLVDGLKKTREARKAKQGDILNHLLRFISRHPFLSQDDILALFLSHANINAKSFADVARAKLTLAAAGTSTSSSSSSSSIFTKMFSRRGSKPQLFSGATASTATTAQSVTVDDFSSVDWWREAVELALEPVDAMQVCRDVLGELERGKKRMDGLKVSIRDFRDKLKLCSETCQYVERSLVACVESESSASASNNNSMVALYAQQASRFRSQAALHHDIAVESSATILSAVREELLLLDAYKDQVMSVRESLVREEDCRAHAQKRERELALVEQEFATAAAATNQQQQFAFEDNKEEPRKLRAARRAKEDALAALTQSASTASVLTRATLTIEINLFREERVYRSERFFQDFAHVQHDYYDRSAHVWRDEEAHAATAAGAVQPDERLVEWTADIPWDHQVPRLVQVVFDFAPENEDEIAASAGERGTAVPVDEDRTWLQLTLQQGGGRRAGLIPTSFVRLVGVVSSNQVAAVVPPVEDDGGERVRQLEAEVEDKARHCRAQAVELQQAQDRCSSLQRQVAEYRHLMEVAQRERDEARAPQQQQPQQQSRSTTPGRESASEDSQQQQQLPENWIKGFDPARQKTFYHNTVTKESVWKFPKAAGAASSPAKRRQANEEDEAAV